MPKFAIAFISPNDQGSLIHRSIESDDKETALKLFFTQEANRYYSDDEQGFFYFKEDFFDSTLATGSIIEI